MMTSSLRAKYNFFPSCMNDSVVFCVSSASYDPKINFSKTMNFAGTGSCDIQFAAGIHRKTLPNFYYYTSIVSTLTLVKT